MYDLRFKIVMIQNCLFIHLKSYILNLFLNLPLCDFHFTKEHFIIQ
jgi:hypothetical protein